MQSLWSRTGPFSSTCRCVSCLSTATNAIAGRTTTAASRRRLWLGNAVTMFYSTIFATAMIIDTNTKTKRRDEWEQKIVAVKEEVKEMQNEEARMLENILSRRRTPKSLLPQRRRQYSTMAAGSALSPRNDHRERMMAEDGGATSSKTRELPQSALEPVSAEQSDLENNAVNLDNEASNWVSSNPLRIRAIQQLATKQLAIRFLLRPVIAHRYNGARKDYAADFGVPKLNADDLLDELNSIRKRINVLKYSESDFSEPLLQDISLSESLRLRQERKRLDRELYHLLHRSDGLSSAEMLMRICNNLLSTEEPVTHQTMSLLINYFVRAWQNDLVTIILNTLLPVKILISQPVIISSLHSFSKSKDLYAFEGFLRRLQGVGGPVNIPKMWETKRVGSVEVPVPPSPGHPAVFTELICCAIKFEQPARADAWLHIMRQTGYSENYAILGTFLRCSAETSDWESGAPFLLRAVTYIMSSKAHTEGTIERLIVYMLIFCHNCQKTELFTNIIAAAIESGFRWELGYNKKDTSLLFQVAVNRWRDATMKSTASTNFHRSIAEKCYSFGTIIGEQIRKATSTEASDRAAQLRKLMAENHSDTNFQTRLSESEESLQFPAKSSVKPEYVRPPFRESAEAQYSSPSVIERKTSAILDALKDSQTSIWELSHAVDREVHRAEIASLRRDLNELRKLVYRQAIPSVAASGVRPMPRYQADADPPASILNARNHKEPSAEHPPQQSLKSEFPAYNGIQPAIHHPQSSIPPSTEAPSPFLDEGPPFPPKREGQEMHSAQESDPATHSADKPFSILHVSSSEHYRQQPSTSQLQSGRPLKVGVDGKTTLRSSNRGVTEIRAGKGFRKLVTYHLADE